jgi:superfamily II DNA or RNA helicase
MILYPYQNDIKQRTYEAWREHQNVLMVLGCGGGKTALFSSIISDETGGSVALTHRAELVMQISLTLGFWKVPHRIVGPKTLVNACIEQHIIEFGKNYINPSARCGVASVQTLIKLNPSDSWFRNVRLWITDESHHCCKGGIWERAINMFPNARGLGVTATPFRADGKGLGRHADGFFDTIVEGNTLRELIDMGRLVDYRIFAPPSDLNLSTVEIGASGEFQRDPLRAAVHKSHLVGDVVSHYLKYAPAKLGLTFTVDVESAEEQAQAFRSFGIPTEAVSAKTDPVTRRNAIRKLKRGDLKMLTNCDLFGEGTDLPAVEVGIFARPTASEPLFIQQFCRPMRMSEGKESAIIIDPVHNIRINYGHITIGRHPLPDAAKTYTLDRQEKRARSETAPSMVRTCIECLAVYDKVKHGMICPYCKTVHVPAQRSGPEFVDGDLGEVDPSVLERSRRMIDAIIQPPKMPRGASQTVINSILKNHREHVKVLSELHDAMLHDARNVTDPREYQRAFYLKHGVDVLTARTLGTKEALKLKERLQQ